MTFLDLMNKLENYVSQPDSDLTASEIGLFTVLALELNKKRDSNNQIDRTQVSIGNFLMCGLLNISKTQLWKSRNRLKQLGIIDFKNGKRKGSYTTYFIGQAFTIRTQTRTQTRTQEETQTRTRIKNKELRDKNIENTKEDTNVSSSPKIPFQEIKKLFNSICISQSKILKINPEREKHIRARWSWLDSIEKWESYFKKIEASTFLRDSSNKNWMDFDWVINETNMTKILEGKYDDKEVSNGGHSGSSRKANEADRFKNPSGESTNYDELEELLVCNSD